ncbi:S49 family peptidase [Enterobacter sp. JMULE2]|uniref:S49 family peptidase n=1 Tax=Enterobacter sp. JMULE2 TaxID=2518340 RepID=UPI001576D96C|nr:S49 family peptidase [Enterobacter sp. JMULE2]NTZ38150.1 S49 family peptidase [Enterobacter sp. JMULE2]
MSRNLAHIASTAFNEPLMLEPAYARVFFSALGKEIGTESLIIPQDNALLSAQDMEAVTASFMSGDRKAARFYEVRNGIAVLPVSGTLVHKLGAMRPFSGMTGYDGIIARLTQAMDDPEVRGVMLDIDSPGGQAAGAFDCADMIARLRAQKPIWALANDMACSAAMLLASACTRRLTTQTGRMGSIGVLMAHANRSEQMKNAGVDITLIYSGAHKVDGNPYSALPDSVRADFSKKMNSARQVFAEKVSSYTGISVAKILATEAAVYDGREAVEMGLAHELVNGMDAIGIMSEQFNGRVNRVAMNDEKARIASIMTCEAARGNGQLANALALFTDASVDQAVAVMQAVSCAGQGIPDSAAANAITSSDAAKGREALAAALSTQPGMTQERAVELLSLAPPPNGSAVLAASFERFMASDAAPCAGHDTAGHEDESETMALLRSFGEPPRR